MILLEAYNELISAWSEQPLHHRLLASSGLWATSWLGWLLFGILVSPHDTPYWWIVGTSTIWVITILYAVLGCILYTIEERKVDKKLGL